jgi:hypothetical protein
MWIVCGLAVALQYRIDNAGRRHRKGVALLSGVILAVCLIEQIDLLSPWLLRSREYAWLARVPKPPPECGTFFVTNFDNEMDAMWVSVWTGLPTINGSSGWEPHGWHLEDGSVGYIDGVRQWIADRTLNETVCVYDKNARTWSVFDRTAHDAAVPAQGR